MSDIRQSQVIHTWPAGSLIDLPELSLIMLNHDNGPYDWGRENAANNKKSILEDNRLAEAFKVQHFVIPPAIDGVNNLSAYAIRFPRAQYCPKCNRIHIITKQMGEAQNARGYQFNAVMQAFFCTDCYNNQNGTGPKLIPMRFVIATEEGFLDDFPWDWYVHKNFPDQRGQGHHLYFISKGASASLQDIYIESRNGGNVIDKRSLGEIFNQEIFTERCPVHGHYLNYVNSYMSKPWKGWHDNNQFIQELISDVPGNPMEADGLSPEAKRKFPRTLQRGAGNVIFPIVYSGILLPAATYQQKCPPQVSTILQNKITALQEHSEEFVTYSNDQWREYFLNRVNQNPGYQLNTLGFDLAQIEGFIRSHFGENTADEFVNKAARLRLQEYKAFTGDYLQDEVVWFEKRNLPGNRYNDYLSIPDFLNQVILLDKLSALKVYKGFTRVKPLMKEELAFANAEDNLDAENLAEFQRIQDARKYPLHTHELPAVEVRGEGIFLQFNNETLNDWAAKYPDIRLKTINDNLTQANITFDNNHEPINKRYLFLHTLSHILLKELSEDCGYSLSSLAEIIYCSPEDALGTDDEMNGILIYTTSSDSDGSLGGLVEKGDHKYLASVIKKGVDKARWCSSDPLCITTDQGQGFMGLNLAACYSCVLLPETSCEKMNKYLDRAALVGTLQDQTIGFFKL